MSELPISELAEINPPLTVLPAEHTTVSMVTMADVSESGRLLSHRPRNFGQVKTGLTRFQNGDILFAKITPCMENGKGAIVLGLENGVGVGSTEFHVLRPRGKNDARYLYQWLQWEATRQKAKLFMSGSAGQQRVPTAFFHSFRIPAPTPTVQTQIANVLASIDTAIEKTEALIAKHQQIKAGLMHDLFTRGVLPNGQLRPPRSEAPELYQETAIGWIPKDWRFTTCDTVCEKIIDCKNRTPPETPDGFPVIRTPNVRNGEFVDGGLAFTDEKSYEVWTMRGKPLVGDVVITREAPVGEVCMIPDRHPNACLGQRMMLYRPNPECIDPRYFLYALQSQQIKNRLELISGGSTVGHVRVGDIRTLWMFMPKNCGEQTLIANALDGAAERLKQEATQLVKLQKQKLGLMQDLLTGKVPVKVDGQTSATADQAIEQKVLARLGERAQAMEVDIDAI